MDPRAGSTEQSGGETSVLYLETAPVSPGIAAVATSFRVANDPGQPRLGFWEALLAVYPTAHRAFADARSKGFIKRMRLSLRALANFGIWRQWHGFLAASPFGGIADFYPRFYEKPFRPYLHRSLGSEERCHVLLQHYQFMSRHAPENLVKALISNQPFLLNENSLLHLGEPLAINLTYAKHMQQEGELTLSLGPLGSLHTMWQHAWIASMTFTVRQSADGWELVVGGVQGGHVDTGKQDAKTATHVFHGLRPKHLLIHVLREMAACWGIARIYGISNTSHSLTRKRYRGRIRIKSSYDELWREAGGQVSGDGYYELPVRVERRSLASVPSRKRAQYQRRFQLLDSIDAEIRAKLAPRQVP